MYTAVLVPRYCVVPTNPASQEQIDTDATCLVVLGSCRGHNQFARYGPQRRRIWSAEPCVNGDLTEGPDGGMWLTF